MSRFCRQRPASNSFAFSAVFHSLINPLDDWCLCGIGALAKLAQECVQAFLVNVRKVHDTCLSACASWCDYGCSEFFNPASSFHAVNRSTRSALVQMGT